MSFLTTRDRRRARAPRRPGQHILCNSMCSALPKAVQAHYILAIEESDVNFVNLVS
jgi:hypothetical protein